MALTQDQLKKQVADAAIEHVKSGIIGVGTGSTANFLSMHLAKLKTRSKGLSLAVNQRLIDLRLMV